MPSKPASTLSTRLLRAAQYLRMSTEHQQYSLANQAAAIALYAAAHNIGVVRSFVDAGKSGTTIKGRKALQELLRTVKRGNADFKLILVYDVSRWGRFPDCDEAAHYEFLCKRAGFAVRYCAEQFENDNSTTSNLLKAIKRTMAGEYSRELAAKVFVAECRIAALGWKQGGIAPFGFVRQLVDKDGRGKQILKFGERKSLATDRVQMVQRWIVAALRNRKFFSLAELNEAIGELLAGLNERPFRKRDGSRSSLFQALDQPALRPLPSERFDMSQWSRATVNIDYHIVWDGNFYSVPYTLVQQVVEVRSTPTTVEIFHRSQRVASHLRCRGRGQTLTQREHHPKSHQAHLAWPPSRMVNWALSIGPHTAQLFERILKEKPHPEMGYRSCLGILRLAQQYSAERVEAAAERALLTQACRYQSVKSILKNSLDAVPLSRSRPAAPPLQHDNLRGADYFDQGGPSSC